MSQPIGWAEEDAPLGVADDAEARAERKADLTARAVRRECKRLLEEASDAAETNLGVGGSAMHALMGVLGALALYVRRGEDPIAALLSVADPMRARSAGRIAGWLQVERERARLDLEVASTAIACGGTVGLGSWETYDRALAARTAFELDHPPDI